MGKMLPIRSFSAQEGWNSANAEIGKRVGQNHGDACRGIKFMCPKGSTDAGVTAAEFAKSSSWSSSSSSSRIPIVSQSDCVRSDSATFLRGIFRQIWT